LYQDQNDLVSKLYRLIRHHADDHDIRSGLAKSMGQYAWGNVIAHYDRLLESLAHEA
jgi:hypothetical protein